MTDRLEVRTVGAERRVTAGLGGPPGIPGPIGPPGPPGPPGGAAFEHVQSTAAATWVATHNFGRRAVIEVVDAADASVIPEAAHTTTAVTITWATPTTGRVVCV